MNQNEVCFKLFGNCIPVKGATRSVICDMQRNRMRFIPNLLYDILTSQNNKTVEETKKTYDGQYNAGIDAFFDLLIKEEWGPLTNEPECFPELNLEWDSPFKITNAIVDVGENSKHDFKEIISQLNDLACEALQIRCYREVTESELYEFIAPAYDSRLKSIELLLKYNEKITKGYLTELILKHKRIRHIIIHSSPFNETFKLEEQLFIAVYSKQAIDSCSHCGVISQSYFAANIPLFTESQKHNTCLNRKISIDENGEIKNCPSMERSFGNMGDTSLHSALAHKAFKELWEINKDQIEVCKDCEFRHICTDCRAYITNPENKYSKPAKCTYNPYTATWEDEKDNPAVKFKLQNGVN